MKIIKFKLFFVITALFLSINILPAHAEMVIVNIKTHVYHKLNCKIAKRCKKGCITTSIERAKEIYKARPCKICNKSHKKKK